MAFAGKKISNPKTGQDIRFIKTAKDTGGKLLEMESTYNIRSKEPIAHYHPYQEEKFTVISGELSVKINGTMRIFKQNEILHIPCNTVHAMWNNSDTITVVNWQVIPAMDTEFLLETFTGLAVDGKTNAEGKPGLLQIALTANKYANVIRLSKPPYITQKILFWLLTPFAIALGYRATDRHYVD